MQISREQKDGIEILKIAGRMDTSASLNVEQELTLLVPEHVRRRLIVDLSGVEYISSFGIRLLLTTAKAVQASEGRMILTGVTKPVMEIFDLANFTMVFEICEALEEALESFSEAESGSRMN